MHDSNDPSRRDVVRAALALGAASAELAQAAAAALFQPLVDQRERADWLA
jgi:hypothetical protein